MSEEILDLTGYSKREAYELLDQRVHQLLDPASDDIAGMATIAALVHHGFRHLWTGFYRVVTPNQLLRVGPYQGSIGCLEIAFGRGVCGDAAAAGRTITVPDVANYPGHIVCDARARSEIVVPVWNSGDDLIAVFDVDSDRVGAFDDEDQLGLERVLRWFAR